MSLDQIYKIPFYPWFYYLYSGMYVTICNNVIKLFQTRERFREQKGNISYIAQFIRSSKFSNWSISKNYNTKKSVANFSTMYKGTELKSCHWLETTTYIYVVVYVSNLCIATADHIATGTYIAYNHSRYQSPKSKI